MYIPTIVLLVIENVFIHKTSMKLDILDNMKLDILDNMKLDILDNLKLDIFVSYLGQTPSNNFNQIIKNDKWSCANIEASMSWQHCFRGIHEFQKCFQLNGCCY